MTDQTTLPPLPVAPKPPGEFTPKLVTLLREGYSLDALRADALAGLTVAIVALPLSMAIAIASGVGPERGLTTAIVGGFLVSALGGSRHQIGGPAGAFIVLVAACVTQIGIEGLILATFLSGIILLAAGALRLGSYVRFIPYPVTVGFTTGIAVIIFASQIKDLLGLSLTGPEPGELLEKLEVLWGARATITPAAVALALAVIAVILGIRRWLPRAPNMLIAVALAAAATSLLQLPVETLGSRFGTLPRLPPPPSLPTFSYETLSAAVPYALSFALLGAIESLLSAVVADGMSGRRHRSNAELVGQGLANMGSALFGGFCVTGTIARTATNVRAGSRGPVSGMLHALFVLGFMLLAAPLAEKIPLAALAGVLAVVAWNMAETDSFAGLLRASKAEGVVVTVTFLLVIFVDLISGIVVGFALGGLVFIRRMSEAASAERAPDDLGEHPEEDTSERVVMHLRGPFFFGAAARIGAALDRIADHPRHLVLDMRDVSYVDASGAHALKTLAEKTLRHGGRLVLLGCSPHQQALLEGSGLSQSLVQYTDSLATVPSR
jgi:SulP family sulfate permease